jgi:hypothetical protein
MSGKYCPQAIITANFWYTLKDMIAIEKFAKEYLKDYTFEWTSNSTIMDNTGKISLNLGSQTSVNYSVTVKKGSTQVLTKTYTTKLNV